MVTIIIPARPEQAEVKAVAAARALDYPPDKLEIILARGKQPSVQRNAAIKAAKGELIYFLDDDSEPGSGNLKRALAQFSKAEVQMVGGPNLCPPNAPRIEQIFSLVLGSYLAFASSRARYARIGLVRSASEKELILCNLVARRPSLLECGGFNEALYPNEENALMDELQRRGGQLIYDPEMFVYRRPRPTWAAFARMLRTYGRGRAEQFRLHPTPGSAMNFVPPLFLLYLALLVPAGIFLGPVTMLPLALYLLLVIVQVAELAVRGGIQNALGAAPLIILTHILYGYGFWRGLFTRLERPANGLADRASSVVLERLEK
jgi:Glycosyltransferases, probably involved in cell wall biogenesis